MVYVLMACKENYEEGDVTYVAGVYAQRATAEAVIASHASAWDEYCKLLVKYIYQSPKIAPKRPESCDVDYKIIEVPMETFGRF